MVTTRPPKTIVKPTALGPVANTDTKLLIYGLFQQGRVLAQDGVRTAGSDRLRGELAGNELRTRKEYVSDRDAGFKQPLERCKLLTRWAFEYFDQTGSLVVAGRGIPVHGGAQPGLSRHPATARSRLATLDGRSTTLDGGSTTGPSFGTGRGGHLHGDDPPAQDDCKAHGPWPGRKHRH